MSAVVENRQLSLAAIFVICKKLDVPLITFYVAGTILHRHWTNSHHKEHELGADNNPNKKCLVYNPSSNIVVLWSAVVYLAVKATEKTDKCGMDGVFACASHLFSTSLPSTQDSNPTTLTPTLRVELIDYEQRLLRDAAFDLADVMRNLPHVFLLNFARLLDLSHAVVQRAWGILNDLSIQVCVIKVRDTILGSHDAPGSEGTAERRLVTGVAFSHSSEAIAAACVEIALVDFDGQTNPFCGGGSTTASNSRDMWWRAVGVSDHALSAVLRDARNAFIRGNSECIPIVQTIS